MKSLQSCLLIFSPKCFKEISQGGLNIKIFYAFLVFHRSYTQVKHRLLDPKKRHVRVEKFALELHEQLLCRWWWSTCNGSPEVAGPHAQLVDKSCDENSCQS
jgi:hypothetical protein